MKTGQIEVYNERTWEAQQTIHEAIEQLLKALTRSQVEPLAYAAQIELEAFKENH